MWVSFISLSLKRKIVNVSVNELLDIVTLKLSKICVKQEKNYRIGTG
jgi:hypothetical protein